MAVLEDEAFIVDLSITQDPSHAMGVCGPVSHGDRVANLRLLAVTRRGCLCDDVIGYHAASITDVKLAREMVIVRKLIQAVAEPAPCLAVVFLSHLVTTRFST